MARRNLILCPHCQGAGVKHHEEMTCYHNREYDVWHTTCTACDGLGRVYEVTTITYEPYRQPSIRV
jgi:DnaJ-class molecular chaperone